MIMPPFLLHSHIIPFILNQAMCIIDMRVLDHGLQPGLIEDSMVTVRVCRWFVCCLLFVGPESRHRDREKVERNVLCSTGSGRWREAQAQAQAQAAAQQVE